MDKGRFLIGRLLNKGTPIAELAAANGPAPAPYRQGCRPPARATFIFMLLNSRPLA